MASRVSIYRPDGAYLADIECRVSRTWRLNAIGQAKIIIANNDIHATPDIICLGNYILIENDRAGDWGGMIWTPIEFHSSHIIFSAYTAEIKLRYRRVVPGSIKGSAGLMFVRLIEMANRQETTNIIIDAAQYAGISWQEDLKYLSIYDTVIKLAENSGQDWSIEPRINEDTRRLEFVANWHERRGSDHYYRLEEGVHLERPPGAGLIIEGDITNDVLVYGNSGSVISSIYTNKIDDESRAQHGLLQQSFGIDATTANVIEAAADGILKTLKQPKARHNLIAIDVNSAFNYLGIGDSVMVRLLYYGFQNGRLGQEFRARIIGKEYDETVGKMALLVEETI